ncbi:hypothetical protein Q5P01_016767 [Channa striata]|uniref:Uncharacterized protein n=1 Tax=Channa striata TaxID=64152 RepID=A0AA88M8T2_CHASR|nr:hypothetical protein Q5P01_016767 [Channa striata]
MRPRVRSPTPRAQAQRRWMETGPGLLGLDRDRDRDRGYRAADDSSNSALASRAWCSDGGNAMLLALLICDQSSRIRSVPEQRLTERKTVRDPRRPPHAHSYWGFQAVTGPNAQAGRSQPSVGAQGSTA